MNEVTTELFEKAPDCYTLSSMPYNTLLNIIRPVGLAPQKAKNLLAMADKVCVCIYGCMDGMYGWLDVCVYVWLDVSYVRLYGCVYVCVYRVPGWIDD